MNLKRWSLIPRKRQIRLSPPSPISLFNLQISHYLQLLLAVVFIPKNFPEMTFEHYHIEAWTKWSPVTRPGCPLLWRHNGGECVLNHPLHDCLLNRLFGRWSKKTSKLRVAGLCAETGEFPAQMVTQKMFSSDDVIMKCIFLDGNICDSYFTDVCS